MVTTAGGNLVQVTSVSSSTGAITLSATANPGNPRAQAVPASFDGRTARWLIEHSTNQGQWELVSGVYTHSTRNLTRPAANVKLGSAGAGVNVDFSTGGLIVSNVSLWDDFDALQTNDGGAITLTAVDLSATRGYDDLALSAPIELALSGATHIGGGTATVRVTGNDHAVTVDNVTVFWADGTAGAKTWADQRTLAFWFHPALGVALAFVPSASSAAVGQLSDLSDVGVTTPTNRNVLVADGDSWESRPLVGADISAEAPILITGNTTLVAATHHGKTLEISAAISPRITCAQIGAGVRCKVHRPAHQPSPILLPPSTNGVWLGGADMGLNRVQADGFAEVEYGTENVPKLRGDLMWGGRPTTADWASIADLTDLRRGQGLSTSTVGNPVSSWASQGAASDAYSNPTAGVQPLLTADGTVRIATTGADKKWLGGVRTAFAGTVMAIAVAIKFNSYTSGEPRAVTLSEAADNRIRITLPSATLIRLNVAAVGQTAQTFNTEFLATQVYRAIVFLIDRSAGVATLVSNSRASSSVSRARVNTYSAAALVPDWTTWTLSGEDNAIGDVAGSAAVDYEFCGVSILDNLAAAAPSGVADQDFLLRLLGQMRSLFPVGADG